MPDTEDHAFLRLFFYYSKEYSLELVLLRNLMFMVLPGCYVTDISVSASFASPVSTATSLLEIPSIAKKRRRTHQLYH